MSNKPLSNLNAALILLIVLILFTIIQAFGGMLNKPSLAWISYIIVIGGITYFVIKYSKDMEHNISFGNLFGYGFKTTAALTLFFIAFTVIFYLIFPEYKLQIQEISRQNALQKATPENRDQIEKGLEFFNRFFWPLMIGGILIVFAILGLLGSLLGAAIAKKNPNEFANDVNQIGK